MLIGSFIRKLNTIHVGHMNFVIQYIFFIMSIYNKEQNEKYKIIFNQNKKYF